MTRKEHFHLLSTLHEYREVCERIADNEDQVITLGMFRRLSAAIKIIENQPSEIESGE